MDHDEFPAHVIGNDRFGPIGKHGEYGGDGLIARESHHRELPVIGHFRWCDVGRASEDVIEIARPLRRRRIEGEARSEEHTSELQSLMRHSYAVFCLKKKNKKIQYKTTQICKSINTRDKQTKT